MEVQVNNFFKFLNFYFFLISEVFSNFLLFSFRFRPRRFKWRWSPTKSFNIQTRGQAKNNSNHPSPNPWSSQTSRDKSSFNPGSSNSQTSGASNNRQENGSTASRELFRRLFWFFFIWWLVRFIRRFFWWFCIRLNKWLFQSRKSNIFLYPYRPPEQGCKAPRPRKDSPFTPWFELHALQFC